MATVVNNPSPVTTDSGSGAGVIVGVIVGIIIVLALIFYAVPALRGGQAPANNGGGIDVNVDLPGNTGGTGNTGGGSTGGTGGTGGTGY